MGSTFNFRGQVHADRSNFGDYGRVDNRVGSLQVEELRQLIKELVQEARTHAADIPDPDGLVSTAGELDTELRRDEPRRGVIRRLVRDLTLGAAGVVAVAEAVEKIRTALGIGA